MKGIIFGSALMIMVGLIGAPYALAYEEIAVTDGGSIKGKVSFKGTAPEPKSFEFAKFPNSDFCAQVDSDGAGNRIVQQVNVKNGALADVVVYLNKVEKGKAFKFDGTDVETAICRFHVQGGPSTLTGVVVKKASIRVLNTDADPNDPKAETGVLHNPHGYEKAGTRSLTLFNLPLAEKGQTIDKPVKLRKKGSFMLIECDQHNYMQVYFQPVANPYYAIVNEDGTFSIDGIPPGSYEVSAFHPILGTQKLEGITVAANGAATADFSFSPK